MKTCEFKNLRNGVAKLIAPLAFIEKIGAAGSGYQKALYEYFWVKNFNF